MKIVIILLLGTLALARNIQVQHNYWSTANRKFAEAGTPYVDKLWNYCDLKCLYFENLVPNADFYVVNFKDKLYKPDFSSCYARVAGGTPKPWNKVYTQENQFFEKNCGADDKDWQAQGYQILNKEGEGIGKQIEY